jgi:hypothetical protein
LRKQDRDMDIEKENVGETEKDIAVDFDKWRVLN